MLGNPSTYIQPGHRKAILWLPDGRKSSYRWRAATACPSTAKMPPKRLGCKASVDPLRMRLANVSIGAFWNGALEQAVMAMTKGRRICRIRLTLIRPQIRSYARMVGAFAGLRQAHKSYGPTRGCRMARGVSDGWGWLCISREIEAPSLVSAKTR